MPHSRALTIGLSLAAGLAVAGTAAGITYATTTTSGKAVYACASRAGTLSLLTKGRCAKGAAKVAINKQGPRGATGPKGSTGPRGLPGPGAVTLATASTTNGVSANKTLVLSAMKLDVGVFCQPGSSAAFTVGFDPAAPPSDWRISGLTYSDASPGFSLKVNGTPFVGQTGAWGFDKPVDALTGNSVRLSVATGYRLQASLLLVRDGHSATVELALDAVYNDACSVRAQVTPSS